MPADDDMEGAESVNLDEHKKHSHEESLKSGSRKCMYWVQEKKLSLEQRIDWKSHHNQRDKMWQISSSYVGDWKNNLRDGFGIQIWPNGSKYEGDWKEDLRHGNGVYYVQGLDQKLHRVYSGGWAHDLKHGLGSYYYKNGNRYEGEWKNGVRHGQGTEIMASGDLYIGGWIDGRKCGWGRNIQVNGNEYVGEWRNNLKEGKGQFFYRDRGMVFEGEWVHGVAQCGVFGPIDEPTSTTAPVPLPNLGVCEPEKIVATRFHDIQTARSAVRAIPALNIEDLFDKQELSDLSRLFEEACEKHGSPHAINVSTLAELLIDVGLNATDDDLARIVLDFDKTAKDQFNFIEFVKAIYLMKQLEIPTGTEDDIIDFEDDSKEFGSLTYLATK